jgi:hypothetical protein
MMEEGEEEQAKAPHSSYREKKHRGNWRQVKRVRGLWKGWMNLTILCGQRPKHPARCWWHSMVTEWS